jgi:DHA2 family multidrug resistance protein-like MFS transporter
VPVLLPLVVLAPFLIPESKDPDPGRIDVPSIVLILVTMTPLDFGVKHLAEAGFDVVTVVSMVVGVASGILFIRRQLRLEHPLLDLSLFRRASFSGAVVINLLSVTALVGGLFFVSQHLQLVLGLAPLDAGLVLLPGLIVMIVAGLVIVPISKRVRPGIVVPVALVVSAVGYASIAITGGDVSAFGIGLAFVALGLGIGSAETVSNELVIASAPPEKAGAASGVSETAYELGAVLGTATLGTVLTASYRSSVVLPDGLTAVQQQAAGETLGGAATVAEQLPGDLAGALMESARHAFDSGVGVAAWIGVGLIVAAMLVAAIGLRRVR